MLHKNLLRVSFGMLLLGVLISSGLLFARPAYADEATIAEGSTGPAVATWQMQLDEIANPKCSVSGYTDLSSIMNVSLDEDSVFGPLTDAATRAFQSKTGLDPDGIVGPLTHAKMDFLLSPPGFDCRGY